MTGQSKLRAFDSVPYTCYEVGHTWDSSCLRTYVGVFKAGFRYSFKIYSTLYSLGLLAKLRNKNARSKKTIKKYVLEILQSSFFLAMNCTYFLIVFCAYRRVFGEFHRVSGVIVGFICSALSLIIERKSRRGLLAMYVLNLAAESLFRIAVARGMVTPINNGEVYLFIVANTVYMSMFRDARLPKYVQDTFEKALGKDEVGVAGLRKLTVPRKIRATEGSLMSGIVRKLKIAMEVFNSVGPHHKRCQHQESCLSYVTKSAVKYFSVGYAIQILLNYQPILQALLSRNASGLGKSLQDISLAKFFCTYSTLFRVSNCLLRWVSGRDNPKLFGAIAGFLSGFSSYYYKSTTISMYFLFKLLEVLCQKAVANKLLPSLPHADIFIYSCSMGVLFHCAIFEPHNIRPSYWRFLRNLSGQKFKEMFRKPLDVFGTEASKMYPDFVPNLDPRSVRSEDVKRILASTGKWGGRVIG